MGKYERIVRIPSVKIDRATAQEIADFMHRLAEDRVTVVLRQRLQETYQQGLGFPGAQALLTASVNVQEEQIQKYLWSEPYRDLIRPTFDDKYTFLSPHGNVQFLFNDFEYPDIPPDVVNAIAESTGANGEVISLNIKANTQVNDFLDPTINRVLIQGPDSAWVNDTAKRFETIFSKNREAYRHFVYRWTPLFVWSTFFFAVVIEYKVAHFMTTLKWDALLNGLQLLLVFAVLAMTLILCGALLTRVLHFIYPYFELENNLSRRRKAWRWPVLAAISLLYASALGLLFGTR